MAEVQMWHRRLVVEVQPLTRGVVQRAVRRRRRVVTTASVAERCIARQIARRPAAP